MKRLSFSLKMFITLIVLCIAGIVFSTIAIDKQIDSYIDEMQTEIQIVNNSENEVVVETIDNKTIIIINPAEDIEEVTEDVINEEFIGLVTSTSGLNIREEPSVNSDKVGVLFYGQEVKIIEDCGDWYRTENGFIFKDYVIKN